MIRLEDCTVTKPTLDDFEEPGKHAKLFIAYVSIAEIFGHILTWRSKGGGDNGLRRNIANSLSCWIRDIPSELKLYSEDGSLNTFDLLSSSIHIPYFVAVTILHYQTDSGDNLRSSLTAAFIASSCMARIYEDFLARDEIRSLPALNSWYLLVAARAQFSCLANEKLEEAAKKNIKLLLLVLSELKKTWPTAAFVEENIISALQKYDDSKNGAEKGSKGLQSHEDRLGILADSSLGLMTDWESYFPFGSQFWVEYEDVVSFHFPSPSFDVLHTEHDTNFLDFSMFADIQ